MSELKAIESATAVIKKVYEVYPKREADKAISHHKYKRCLAMSKWCKAMCGHYLSYEEPEWFWFRKWSDRWLKIAEKFK